MIHPLIAQITLAFYAILLGVGGVMGFVKARSHPSLISGLLSAFFAVVALGLSLARNPLGIPLGMLLAITLFILFGYRYALRNRTFMPNGMLAVVSLVVLSVMILARDWQG